MASIYYNDVKYGGVGAQGSNGKNAEVAKIEPIIGGNKVTFTYYDDAQTMQSSSVEIMNGVDGKSIKSARVENGNVLILTLSDDSEISAGAIVIDSSNLKLDNYYDIPTIDQLLEDQKTQMEEYVEVVVEEKVEVKVDETITVVSENDLLDLF